MFEGKPLKEQGGAARHITAAFDQTIAVLDAGGDIPDSAISGIRKAPIPEWAYFTMANLGMALGAAKYGNLFKIGAKPYPGKKTA
jgi:hypothetical protein